MKNIKNFQIWLAFMAFLGTLVILFGGQALTSKIKVTDPLKEAIQGKKEIVHFKFEPRDNGVAIHLQLKKTGDLQSLMEFVKEKAEFYHKKQVTDFVIESLPNSRLKQVEYQLSFYLEEAVASGRYIQLKSALDGYRDKELNVKAYLADNFIYLQLEDGKNYLYRAIPRPSQITTLNNSTSGGEVKS